MKPYRRNYATGMGLFLVGLVMVFLTPSGTMDTVGKFVAVAGVILAGWSGRQWWYYEKEAKVTE